MKMALSSIRPARPSFRVGAALASAGLAAVLVAACGSSGTSSSTKPAAAATTGTTSTAACLANAAKVSQAAQITPPFSVTPLPKPASSLSLKSKTAWFITPLSISVFVTMSQSFAAAAKDVGMPERTFDAGTSPTTENAAINEAVDNNAALIVIDGVATAEVTPGLQAALTHHIPVISVYEPATTPVATQAVKSVINVSIPTVARYGLATALQATGCHMTMGVLYQPAFSAEAGIEAALQQQLPQMCPSCSIATAQYNLQTEATSAGPQAAALVSSHKGMNVLYLAGASLIPAVIPSLTHAKLSVKVLSNGATPPGLQFLNQSSSEYIGDTATGSYPLVGWIAMDTGLRILGGFPADTADVIPLRQLTKTSDPTDIYPNLANYQQLFINAWKD
jgi:ABC-type sugar transport system substrate-binding protein